LGCTEIFAAVIINICAYLCTFGCIAFSGFYTVEQKEAVIFQVFGKVWFVKTEPGLYYSPLVVGRMLEKVNTSIQTQEVVGSSVPDLNGSPMNVSAIINFVITDPTKATFAINDLRRFITNQAQEVVRNVCA